MVSVTARTPHPEYTTSDLFSASVNLAFTKENMPNAEVLLPSLRQSGYSLETAIGDLADNPLDADADVIVVTLDKQGAEWSVSVADNGSGMTRDILDQMMRLGSRVNHDLTTDLGAFGLGSTTASLSLGRRQHVITSPAPGVFISGATDLDETVKAREFVKHLDDAQPAEIELFRQAFTRWDLDVPSTGTLVRVTKCDNIGRSQVGPAVDAVKKYIGTTYRYFIAAGKRFYVNGELVERIDPLERHHAETMILFEDTFEYAYPKGHARGGEIESIGTVLVQLPSWGGTDENRAHGYTVERSGFYIMRNRREIVAATTLNFYTRHNEFSRFRGEVLFPASMDQDLGVSFLKSAWDVKPSQSLRDKLQEVVRPYLRQSRRFYNSTQTNSSEDIPHAEAAKTIKQRSPFLRRPKSIIERRASPQVAPQLETREYEEPKRSRTPRVPYVQSALTEAATFTVKDLGPTAPFFEAALVGRKVVITYNGQHPFYQRFILENRDNRSIVTGIDYLTYSIATAELLAQDEDTYRFIERMREDMSFNLRQLLTM
jgi:hypothetical protein